MDSLVTFKESELRNITGLLLELSAKREMINILNKELNIKDGIINTYVKKSEQWEKLKNNYDQRIESLDRPFWDKFIIGFGVASGIIIIIFLLIPR